MLVADLISPFRNPCRKTLNSIRASEELMADDRNQIYHEKQKLQFCLLHALNNLFQEKDAFMRKDLDEIAEKLVLEDPYKGNWTPLRVIFKPHHNSLTGNYDINVLIAAVERKGKKVIWHDRRNKASSINLEESESKLTGIVLNVPVKRYGGIWKSRHWVCLRKINGVWYNLDSDFATPYSFDNVEELRGFLEAAINGGTEILLVKEDE